MAGIEISALGRKLRLLIEHGHFENWDSLALEFGRSSSTVQWWGHGDDDREPNILPEKHLEIFFTLIEKNFPNILNREEAKDFAFAPLAEWEACLKTHSFISMNRLIEAEAIEVSARLFLKPTLDAGLIETDRSAPKPAPQLVVNLDQWFRLELNVSNGRGYFSALQNAGHQWGAVHAHFDKEKQAVLLPGVKNKSDPAFMVERRDVGIHRFIVMHTAEPLPNYKRHLEDGLALDSITLTRMAHFFSEQPIKRRRIFLASIRVQAPSS